MMCRITDIIIACNIVTDKNMTSWKKKIPVEDAAHVDSTVKLTLEPDSKDLQAFARRIYPVILAYFESEDGKREFEEWKAKVKVRKTQSEKP